MAHTRNSRYSYLQGALLLGTNLKGALLMGANLQSTKMMAANLQYANLRISGFSAGDFARIRQAISLQSGTLLRRVLGARLDASLLTK